MRLFEAGVWEQVHNITFIWTNIPPNVTRRRKSCSPAGPGEFQYPKPARPHSRANQSLVPLHRNLDRNTYPPIHNANPRHKTRPTSLLHAKRHPRILRSSLKHNIFHRPQVPSSSDFTLWSRTKWLFLPARSHQEGDSRLLFGDLFSPEHAYLLRHFSECSDS